MSDISCVISVSLKARKLLNNGDHFIKFYVVKVSKIEIPTLYAYILYHAREAGSPGARDGARDLLVRTQVDNKQTR